MAQIPARRHVIADVRLETGLSQAELAKILGVAAISIQKIEQGSLKLSEDLAIKAQKVFDVSAAWLLTNDPTQLAVTPRGDLWTEDFYELTQGTPPGHSWEVHYGIPKADAENSATAFTNLKAAEFGALIHAMLQGAKGRPKQGILLHRLRKALETWKKDFPPDKGTLEKHRPVIEKAAKAFKEAQTKITELGRGHVWGDKPARPKSKEETSDDKGSAQLPAGLKKARAQRARRSGSTTSNSLIDEILEKAI